MKYLKVSIYGLSALLIILLATALRLVLIALGWPLTNSDEGTIGMMALHIAYRGEHPIFFYGQNYMGAWEAYLGAAIFHLIGPSLFSLRLGLVLMFVVFLVCIYVLTSLLYSKPMALITLVLLGGGSSFVMARELSAIGGYSETLMFGAFVFLCAAWLALSYRPGLSWRQNRWRYVAYLAWGLAAGLALWSDLLVAPMVLMSSLLILCFCWRELLRVVGALCMLVGLLVGAYPLIRYNLHAAPHQDSLSTLRGLQGNGLHHTLPVILAELKGTFQISIPMVTGNPFCPVTELSFIGPTSPHTLQCTLIHSTWSLGYVLLLAASVIMTAWAVWRSWRGSRHAFASDASEATLAEHNAFVRHTGGLLLLISALITLYLYASSAATLDWPGIHARYLLGMLIATPAVIWPLWQGASAINRVATNPESLAGVRFTAPGRVRFGQFACRLVLALGMLLMVLGSVLAFTEVPSVQAQNQRDYALIDDLVQKGITHIYTDYWTCDKIAFMSSDRLTCVVVNGQLQSTYNRYKGYIRDVNADPHAAYAFPSNSSYAAPSGEHVAAVEDKSARTGIQYERFVIDGYVIYRPV
jgi:hypothetical protein